MHMTQRWLKRCCDRFDITEGKYDMIKHFPCCSGSIYKDSEQSAEQIASFEKENAIGTFSR